MAEPFIPVPEVVSVEMLFTYNSQLCENRLHFHKAGGWTETDMDAIRLSMHNWWNTDFKGYFTNVNGMIRWRITDLSAQDAPVKEYSDNNMGSAGIATQQAPGHVTLAIKVGTAKRGRAYRGRIYHIGLLEDDINGNQVVGLVAIDLFEKYNKLILRTAQGTDYTFGVVSKRLNGVWRTTGVFEPATYVAVDDNIDSQRRRLANRGR